MNEQQGEHGNAEDQRHDPETTQDLQAEHPAREEELTCVACGHPIEQDDLECPNCGISLVAG
jgi:rubrerythrin